MLTYYDRMSYGFYDDLCFRFVNALGTVSVFYEIDNFLNVDYGPQHDYGPRHFVIYVVELCIVLVDCDDFFLSKSVESSEGGPPIAGPFGRIGDAAVWVRLASCCTRPFSS